MFATLIKPVRDNCGWWHTVGEHATVVSMNKRGQFDARLLINVVFENGAHGALFSDEIFASGVDHRTMRSRLEGEGDQASSGLIPVDKDVWVAEVDIQSYTTAVLPS